MKFMIATGDDEVKNHLAKFITSKFHDAVLYLAKDGPEIIQKFKFDAPQILILDENIEVRTAHQIIGDLSSEEKYRDVPIILLCDSGKIDGYADAITLGKLAPVSLKNGIDAFVAVLFKMINYVQPSSEGFTLKYYTPGEIIVHEGERGEHLYILKKGKLTAYTGTGDTRRVLGQISPGEFVGEMAYIHGEPRSATVVVDEDSELVEFKMDAFERIIYNKPSWMKVLLTTLSRRIKKLNFIK